MSGSQVRKVGLEPTVILASKASGIAAILLPVSLTDCFADSEGLEPPTNRLEGGDSVQLSYESAKQSVILFSCITWTNKKENRYFA